jgi:hypothetical protein
VPRSRAVRSRGHGGSCRHVVAPRASQRRLPPIIGVAPRLPQGEQSPRDHMNDRLRTWFRDDRPEVDHFASAPRSPVPRPWGELSGGDPNSPRNTLPRYLRETSPLHTGACSVSTRAPHPRQASARTSTVMGSSPMGPGLTVRLPGMPWPCTSGDSSRIAAPLSVYARTRQRQPRARICDPIGSSPRVVRYWTSPSGKRSIRIGVVGIR